MAQLGYDGVEIAPFTLADSVTEISQEKRKAIRRAAEKNGIEIIGLHWLLVKPEGIRRFPEPGRPLEGEDMRLFLEKTVAEIARLLGLE